MKYGLVPAAFSVVFCLLLNSLCWGTPLEQDVAVYFRGEEIKLSLVYQDGRFYGFRPEMSQLLLPASGVEQSVSPADNGQWLPLRTYWEELGFRVLWRPALKAIIISDNPGDPTIPPAALAIAEQAIADTEWLTAETEDSLAAHFRRFYTPETVGGLVKDTWEFIKVETDWHSLYTLKDAQLLDRGEDWCLLEVTVSETHVFLADPVTFPGIMKLYRLDSGWRIGAYRYLADGIYY
ncbi:MAG: hypothetical protein GX750_00195 [Clostridia bacterium]|nr:hypothetical protein [Clostridia bacterium]